MFERSCGFHLASKPSFSLIILSLSIIASSVKTESPTVAFD